MALKIKVCGMRDAENIRELEALGPDYIGFIFYERSARYMGDIDPKIVHAIGGANSKVGVFVDASEETVLAAVHRFGFDAVQLHGDESPEFCRRLGKHVTVWKTFGIDAAFDFSTVETYSGAVDLFLFDTKTELKGGSGERFEWSKLDEYKPEVPYILSGGIGPEHLAQIGELTDRRLHGVDLNSRFELAPALKDVNKLSEAFRMLKSSRNQIQS